MHRGSFVRPILAAFCSNSTFLLSLPFLSKPFPQPPSRTAASSCANIIAFIFYRCASSKIGQGSPFFSSFSLARPLSHVPFCAFLGRNPSFLSSWTACLHQKHFYFACGGKWSAPSCFSLSHFLSASCFCPRLASSNTFFSVGARIVGFCCLLLVRKCVLQVPKALHVKTPQQHQATTTTMLPLIFSSRCCRAKNEATPCARRWKGCQHHCPAVEAFDGASELVLGRFRPWEVPPSHSLRLSRKTARKKNQRRRKRAHMAGRNASTQFSTLEKGERATVGRNASRRETAARRTCRFG